MINNMRLKLQTHQERGLYLMNNQQTLPVLEMRPIIARTIWICQVILHVGRLNHVWPVSQMNRYWTKDKTKAYGCNYNISQALKWVAVFVTLLRKMSFTCFVNATHREILGQFSSFWTLTGTCPYYILHPCYCVNVTSLHDYIHKLVKLTSSFKWIVQRTSSWKIICFIRCSRLWFTGRIVVHKAQFLAQTDHFMS